MTQKRRPAVRAVPPFTTCEGSRASHMVIQTEARCLESHIHNNKKICRGVYSERTVETSHVTLLNITAEKTKSETSVLF